MARARMLPATTGTGDTMKHIPKLFQAMVLATFVASVGMVGVGVVEGCSAAQRGAGEVVPILTKISDAAQYLDAAWGAFCLFRPSVCQQYGGEYQRAKGILAASLLAARDTTEAVAGGGKVDDVRKAYAAIEALLLKLGVVVPQGTLAAARSDGWTPWEAPKL